MSAILRLGKNPPYGFAVVVGLFIGLSVYSVIRLNILSTRIYELSTDVVGLSANLASTTARLTATIAQVNSSLASALSAEHQNVNSVQAQLGSFQSQVGSITGTVSDLQKLSKIDPELLKKYSKVYFLSDNYVPAHLSEIPLKYQYSDRKQMLIESDILSHLQVMIETASTTGTKLYVFSAYRSFAEQKALKSDYQMTYGAGTANSFSADQGYSEHQLGTTVDLITPGLGGVVDGFDNTAAYQWMLNNAYKFGFILSYPKSNGYYVFEPWHWRFVGVKLATDLHVQNKNFYDLDQRVIDTYLISIFD